MNERMITIHHISLYIAHFQSSMVLNGALQQDTGALQHALVRFLPFWILGLAF